VCIEIKKSIVTKKDMIAYKKVKRRNSKTWCSPIEPRMRIPQINRRGVGGILKYTIGKVTKSGIPGIYLHINKPIYCAWDVLRVKIPAGSRCYIGTHGKMTAERVIPLELVGFVGLV